MKPNFNQIMKQAQQLQSKLEQAQRDIKALTVDGVAGAGLVKVKLDGTHRVHSVKIHPDLMKKEDLEVLEDLVAAAYNDAARKIEEATKKIMEDVAGGAGGLPGGMGGLGNMLT